MSSNELKRLEAGVKQDDQVLIEEQRSPCGHTSRLPLRSVDVFHDLGMTDEIIARYLGRWGDLVT